MGIIQHFNFIHVYWIFSYIGENPTVLTYLSTGNHTIGVRAYCMVGGELQQAKEQEFIVPY